MQQTPQKIPSSKEGVAFECSLCNQYFCKFCKHNKWQTWKVFCVDSNCKWQPARKAFVPANVGCSGFLICLLRQTCVCHTNRMSCWMLLFQYCLQFVTVGWSRLYLWAVHVSRSRLCFPWMSKYHPDTTITNLESFTPRSYGTADWELPSVRDTWMKWFRAVGETKTGWWAHLFE